MTTPDVPLRFELTVEVPGSPEQVWDAIATANGIGSWMGRTELEEREGGRLVLHMGPGMDSEGTITGWDPPRRIEYAEPEWAALAGRPDAEVTPLVSEFIVEATSGGTCVVKVVSSAFGTGAAWEEEFIEEMGEGWAPSFEILRLYLTHFPGREVTHLEAYTDVTGSASDVLALIRRTLQIDAVGQSVEMRDGKGEVELILDHGYLVRLTDPIPGVLAFFGWDTGEDTASVSMRGYLYSEDAPAYTTREQAGWQAWLEDTMAPLRP